MKKTILNLRWIFFVFNFSLLTFLGVLTSDDNLWISIAMIAAGIFLILGYAFIIPNRYTFSEKGIMVRYCFGLKNFLGWSNIKHMEDRYAGRKAFPWWREYEIGYFNTKIIFHEKAILPKNRRITEQLEKYYHKTIEKCG